MSGKSISPVLEANYIFPCDDLLPHLHHSIRGDGNCLFHALPKEVTGFQKHHLAVTLAIVNYIQCYDHPPEVSHYFVKEFEKQTHLTSPAQCLAACKDYVKSAAMSKLGVWGTESEIFTAATMFQTIIVIYTTVHESKCEWYTYRPLFHDTTCMANCGHSLYLYNTGNHYHRVVPIVTSSASAVTGTHIAGCMHEVCIMKV